MLSWCAAGMGESSNNNNDKNMKREIKIGLFAVVMIGAAWAGIRFLKGFDIFGRNVDYYAAYERIDGLQSASPVMMRGVKIGTVTDIVFDPARSEQVVLRLTVKRQYAIPSDSEARIVSSSLMGSKAVEVVYGEATTWLSDGDTLRSTVGRDLMDMAGSELDFVKKKISQVTDDLSRTLTNLNKLLEGNASHISGALGHLDALTGDLSGLLASERSNLERAVENLTGFSEMLGANAGRVDSIVGSLNHVALTLDEEQFAQKLTQAVDGLNGALRRIESGEGTVGRLLEDPALYDSLTTAAGNLSALLADVKQYPGRYVHLSVFGRDPEKMKERAERRTAKAATKAGRDSLKAVR